MYYTTFASEISHYGKVLNRLHAARQNFDAPQYDALSDSPRQPCIYERELEAPRLGAKPLPQPCPHVYDSAPMRPVTVALQDGVGMLFNAASVGRASVLGKLWGQ